MSIRERKKRQARQDILGAARQLIDERGYTAATMREIATAADISYQTLYNYFPTKAQILQAILIGNVERLGASIDHIIEEYDHNLLATLQAVNRARMGAFAEGDRSLWQEVAAEIFQHSAEANTIYHAVDQAAHRLLQALFEAAQRAGELDETVSSALLADTVFALSQHAFGRFIADTTITEDDTLRRLAAQAELLIAPYLQ